MICTMVPSHLTALSTLNMSMQSALQLLLVVLLVLKLHFSNDTHLVSMSTPTGWIAMVLG